MEKNRDQEKNNKNYILYTEPLTLITQFHEISYFFIIFIPLFIFKKPQKAAEDVDLQRIGRINQFAQGSKRSSSRWFSKPCKSRECWPWFYIAKVSSYIQLCHNKGFDSENKILHLEIEVLTTLWVYVKIFVSPTFLPSKKWRKNMESTLHSATVLLM